MQALISHPIVAPGWLQSVHFCAGERREWQPFSLSPLSIQFSVPHTYDYRFGTE